MSLSINIKRVSILALSVVFAASIFAAAMPSLMAMGGKPVGSSDPIEWDGVKGLDSEKCDLADDDQRNIETGWLHWVLTPGGPTDVIEAELSVNGDVVGTMTPQGESGALQFFMPFVEPVSATATPDGELGDRALLTISDWCPGEGENGDDTVAITLLKEWYDVDGNLIDQPTDASFTISATVGPQADVVLTLTNNDEEGKVNGTLDLLLDDQNDLQPARYGINEVIEGDGFEVANCEGLSDTPFTNQGVTGTPGFGFSSGVNDDGTFPDVVHLVCNQEIPETYRFQFDKEWEGDTEGINLEELEIVFYADDEFDWTLGVDPPVEVVPGETTLTNVREEVTGLPAQCTSTADVLPLETLTAPEDVELYGEDNLFTLTVTNTIECEGVVLGDDDEKKEGEILAATTVRSLPETGSSASTVASIAAIVATSLAMASSLVKGAFVRFTA